jgi:hypothetical protein
MTPFSAVQQWTDTTLWALFHKKALLDEASRGNLCVQTPPLETVQNSIDLHFLVPHLHNLAKVIGNVLGIYLPAISSLLETILISCPELKVLTLCQWPSLESHIRCVITTYLPSLHRNNTALQEQAHEQQE